MRGHVHAICVLVASYPPGETIAPRGTVSNSDDGLRDSECVSSMDSQALRFGEWDGYANGRGGRGMGYS